ncbi:CcdC family protein [Litchfieldia alkalitelluris]|uniref:CcdC family protein n=1 Tax=Litchfieldia alkalitelluris TaxID=304268 RepID=UPI000997C560|nr:cytochrome c biogenesis protein CcdC [Litchfieldia alkalitelluris]
MVIATSILAFIMACLVTVVRVRAAKQPTSIKKIVLPPIFMSSGALMFLHPMFRISTLHVFEAVGVGILFSILLIKTSSFEVKDNEIYLKRSKAFIFILMGLLIIRIILKTILSSTIDIGELSGMFWVLAFGMIVPWRIGMLIKYRQLRSQLT